MGQRIMNAHRPTHENETSEIFCSSGSLVPVQHANHLDSPTETFQDQSHGARYGKLGVLKDSLERVGGRRHRRWPAGSCMGQSRQRTIPLSSITKPTRGNLTAGTEFRQLAEERYGQFSARFVTRIWAHWATSGFKYRLFGLFALLI